MSPMDSSGFEPEAPSLQGRCSTRLSYEPTTECVWAFEYVVIAIIKKIGGDPAAGSPTATL